MLNRLAGSGRCIALREMKPIPRVQQRTNGTLVWRATLHYRNCSLVMLLKLWVSKCHNA